MNQNNIKSNHLNLEQILDELAPYDVEFRYTTNKQMTLNLSKTTICCNLDENGNTINLNFIDLNKSKSKIGLEKHLVAKNEYTSVVQNLINQKQLTQHQRDLIAKLESFYSM